MPHLILRHPATLGPNPSLLTLYIYVYAHGTYLIEQGRVDNFCPTYVPSICLGECALLQCSSRALRRRLGAATARRAILVAATATGAAKAA